MLRAATISGLISPRVFAPQSNFLAGGQARRLVEVDRHYDDSEVIWQEAIYHFARAIADEIQLARIVDIGTGTGVKLYDAFAGHTAIQLQTDWRDQRTPVPDGLPTPDFLAVNLEDFHDLEALESVLDPCEQTLFILSDVIGHLLDPRPVLRTLRRLLKRHPNNRLVISTPDRCRIDGAGAEGLPDNRGYVRQWTLNEFGLAMLSAGFVVRQIGRLPQNRYDTFEQTICAELACTPEAYCHWLSMHGLPAPADHVVLTTEHAALDRSGGIGTYLQLAAEADGLPRLILFAGGLGLPETGWRDVVQRHGWIHVAEMSDRADRPLHEVSALDADEILQAVVQTLFLYDDVRLIEYHDYCGIGYRVAQAKRAGLLPPSVTVMAFAHGGHFLLDAAAGIVTGERALGLDAQERLSIELADVVALPSRYIRDLYMVKAGFRPRAERYLRLPFRLAQAGLDDLSRGPVRNLVFFGKQMPLKGYPDFIEAVLALFADPAHADAAARVTRILLLGVTDPDPRLAALPVMIEHGTWNHAETMAMLRRLAADSLVVLPYRGDNHPLSVLEVIDHDCQLLAFNAGGLPELLPDSLHEMLLCAPNAASLAAGMARALSFSHWERCRLLDRTRELVRAAYLQHTEAYKATMAELKRGGGRRRTAELGAVTIVLPNLNGTAPMLRDAALGLRNSFHRPARVLLVDDGSSTEGLAVLENSAAAFGDIPTEMIRNPINLGLAGARNIGLACTKTPYVCAHDNDDIVLNRFLEIACGILDENPEVAAVAPWVCEFEDGSAWQTENWGKGCRWRPLGADLGHALRINSVGGALSVYRVSALREVGGWNETSKAKWEDWELFLRLLAASKDVWVIPHELMLYRVRAQSMLRTYPDFPAWLRLANGIPGLPKAQAVALLRAIWTPSIAEGDHLAPAIPRINWLESERQRLDAERQRLPTEAEYTATMTELARLRAIEATTTWRATRRVRRLLEAHPMVRLPLRAVLVGAWRGTRWLRNTIRPKRGCGSS